MTEQEKRENKLFELALAISNISYSESRYLAAKEAVTLYEHLLKHGDLHDAFSAIRINYEHVIDAIAYGYAGKFTKACDNFIKFYNEYKRAA